MGNYFLGNVAESILDITTSKKYFIQYRKSSDESSFLVNFLFIDFCFHDSLIEFRLDLILNYSLCAHMNATSKSLKKNPI